MSVANTFDAETGVVHCMGGFEDGSVLVWDTRNTGEELARLKLFSEPGIYGIKKDAVWYFCCFLVLCMDFSSQQFYGIAGSPTKNLEAFSLSTKEVNLEHW